MLHTIQIEKLNVNLTKVGTEGTEMQIGMLPMEGELMMVWPIIFFEISL